MSKPKTFYLAAPSSDIPRAQALARRVRGATGCALTHDWMQHILDGNPPTAKAALDDLKAIERADFVVLIDGPSRGASVEFGWALGIRKPVFVLSMDPDMWTQLLAFTRFNGGVEPTEDMLITSIRSFLDVVGYLAP